MKEFGKIIFQMKWAALYIKMENNLKDNLFHKIETPVK